MQNLITIVNEEITISHRIVAEQTNNQEVSVRNILNKFISDFEVFGRLHFKNEVEKKNNQGGLKPITYFLNEQQAYLLLTYLRNNEIVRNFKITLVKAFFEMKKQLENKSSNNDLKKILNQIEKQNKTIKLLENELSLYKQQEQHSFSGYYDSSWFYRKRENPYALTREGWLLLLDECERTLAYERQNRSHTRQLSYKGGNLI